MLVHVETLQPPSEYTSAQIHNATTLAAILGRGKLILVEPPLGRHTP